MNVINGKFTGVRAHVAQTVGAGAEGLGAVLALVIPLAGVDAAVHAQGILARELLVAEFALVVFLERGGFGKVKTGIERFRN